MKKTSPQIQTYDDHLHRKQVTDLWESVLDCSASYKIPAVVIDMKLEVDDRLYVALERDRVIGTIMVGWDGHRGWIYSLAVSPHRRKQGVGSALLNHAETVLSEAGCLKINLQIHETNREVRAFYKANGFYEDPVLSMGKRL